LLDFWSIAPFEGYLPKGFIVDFLGCQTDANLWDLAPEKQALL